MLKDLFVINVKKVVELTRKDLPKDILDKYFRYNNHDLDRFHLPEISEEDYTIFVKNNKIKNKDNLKLATASDYYKLKAAMYIAEKDLKCRLDFTDYVKDDEFYEYYSFLQNEEYTSESYRDNTDDNRYATAYDVYVKQDPKKATLDLIIYNALYDFCLEMIKNRLAMIFNVDKCLALLKNIEEYSLGFTENITESQRLALENMFRHYTELLSGKTEESKQFLEFTKENNDYTVYAQCELCNKDYISYYQKLLRLISDIRDTDLNYMYEFLHNPIDSYEDIILENTMEFEEDYYSENSKYEEDEEYTLVYA